MDNVIYLANCIGYIVLYMLALKYIFRIGFSANKKQFIIIGIIVFCSAFVLSQLKNPILRSCILFLTVFLAFRVVCGAKMRKAAVYVCLAIPTVEMLIQMGRILVILCQPQLAKGIGRDICEMLSLGIAISFVLIVKNNTGKTILSEFGGLPLKYGFLFAIIVLIDSVSILLLGDFIMVRLEAERKWIAEASYLLMILGVFVQLGLLIAMILSRDEHKEKEALNAKYLEEQVSHYEYLEEREQETRKFRHDMRNHLMILRNLYDTGKTKEFEKYFDTITDRITNFGNQISVGNNTADAIINQYAKEAELAGITLQVEGRFPTDCHIDAVDICTIFANLLSNAIRAEKESDGHQVNLIVRNMDNELFIQVQNDYVTQIKRSGERFVSTKEDRGNHGLGLQNVYDCVERNHGIIHITTDNQIFDVKLSLKNTEA